MGRRRRRRFSNLLLLLLALGGFAVWADAEDCRVVDDDRIVDDYDREAWPHWVDADRDCQNTRQEVLIEESEIPVTFKGKRRCKVARGRWRCAYTGRVFTDPRELDVDHLVPLHDAHRSGGSAWTRARRELFANNLADADHLVAVEASANRKKSDKSPDEWLPSDANYRCRYVERWQEIKEKWHLRMTSREEAFVREARDACARGETLVLPDRAKAFIDLAR